MDLSLKNKYGDIIAECSIDQYDSLPNEISCDSKTLKELIQLKPKERGQIKIFGKTIDVPRYQLNIGEKGYSFSGTTSKSEYKEPSQFHPYIHKIREWVRKTEHTQEYQQILMNWYMNGSEYIGPHSDDEKQLIKGSKIYSFSLGATREFIITPRKEAYAAVGLVLRKTNSVGMKRKRGQEQIWIDQDTKEVVNPETRGIQAKIILSLQHNTYITMNGKMQQYYYHQVPKIKQTLNDKPRINITLRRELTITS